MAKKIIPFNPKHPEAENTSDTKLTVDERLSELMAFIAMSRNVFFTYDTDACDAVPRAIKFLEEKGYPIWHKDADALTIDELAPLVIEDDEERFDNHHIWDGYDVIFLRRCEAIYQNQDLCGHLLATIAILNQNNEFPVVIMTHSGDLPDYKDTCRYYEDLEQRLLQHIV